MANDIDLTKFKGRVFDLWTDYTFSQDSEINWFEELKVLLAEFFDVRFATYYKQDAHTFIQLNWNHSLIKKEKPLDG